MYTLLSFVKFYQKYLSNKYCLVRENFFKEAGEIAQIRLASDREGKFKGFGHVEFATAEAAQDVC